MGDGGSRQQRPRFPVVFTLQRGVRTGGIVKDGLKAVVNSPSPGAVGGVAVVEGLVGFAVARVLTPSPTSSSSSSFFACTVPSPKIALERLSKVITHHHT